MAQATQIVNSLRNAKQVLFVIHEYLPLQLALWVPLMARMLSEQGKQVAVLISEESKGWLQHVDKFYPTDMLLSLEQLRQEIVIPFEGDTISDLSYVVEDGKLKLSVVPEGDPLKVEGLSATIKGNSFDCVVMVGITGKHTIFETLREAKSSLAHAEVYSLGSAIQHASLSQQLPRVKSVDVIEGSSVELLENIIIDQFDKAKASDSLVEQAALFIYSATQLHHKEMYLSAKAHAFLAKIFEKPINTANVTAVTAHDENQVARSLQPLLSSQQITDSSKIILLHNKVAANEIEQCLRALYHLPKYENANAVVVILSENDYTHHIFVSAERAQIKQVALKYALPFTDIMTGGLIREVYGEKLSQDLLRLLAGEEVTTISSISDVSSEVDEVAKNENVEQAIETEEVPLPPAKKEMEVRNSPSLDEVLARTTMSANNSVVDDEVPTPPEIDTPPAPPTPAPVPTIPAVSPSIPVQEKASVGLDFATIAKKMRESIQK